MNSGSEWKADALPRAAFSAPGLENRRKGGGNRRDDEEDGPGGGSSKKKNLKVTNPIYLDTINEFCEESIN